MRLRQGQWFPQTLTPLIKMPLTVIVSAQTYALSGIMDAPIGIRMDD